MSIPPGKWHEPWKPGQSGNPSGRPKGVSLTKLLQQFLDGFTLEQLQDLNADQAAMNALTGKEAAALKWAMQLLAGAERSREQALDRLEGSVAQTMRHELNRQPTRTPEEIRRRLAMDQASPEVIERERLVGNDGIAGQSEIPPPGAIIGSSIAAMGARVSEDVEVVPGASCANLEPPAEPVEHVSQPESSDVPRGMRKLGPPGDL